MIYSIAMESLLCSGKVMNAKELLLSWNVLKICLYLKYFRGHYCDWQNRTTKDTYLLHEIHEISLKMETNNGCLFIILC